MTRRRWTAHALEALRTKNGKHQTYRPLAGSISMARGPRQKSVVDLGGNAIDTTSAAGRFMLTVLAGAAEMERNLTRDRIKSAMAVKPANGQRIGAMPYGYDLAGDGKTLVPD